MPAITFPTPDLAEAFRALGRARVLRATAWDCVSNLDDLAHLGDTEGDQSITANEAFSHLTLPELMGPGKQQSYLDGADPVATIPMFLADPANRAILTPVGGSGGTGFTRRQPVAYHTLVLLPEELFRKADGTYDGVLTYLKTGTVWKLDGVALTTEQQRLLDLSIWLWRGYFMTPPINFKHGDGGKLVDQVQFQVCQQPLLPNGQQLYTRGDPGDYGIDIDPTPA